MWREIVDGNQGFQRAERPRRWVENASRTLNGRVLRTKVSGEPAAW